MESPEKWPYKDFLTFLLILGANADLEISEEEKDQIIFKVGEENYNRIKHIFDRQNDAQRIETVVKLYERFDQEIGGKENLAKTLREVFHAGGSKEKVMDRYLLIMLKKIL
ncbi:MAG: hypothetical protein RIC15_04240 [Vicingaceae bacterium]